MIGRPLLIAFGLLAATLPVLSQEPIHLRELYVPYEEFRRLTESKRDGVVMNLLEYRELVEAAASQVPSGTTVLPPLSAVVTSARYTGVVEGKTLRLTVRATVLATEEDWVRCELGPRLPSLSGIRVDGAPGWVVTGSGSSPRHLLLLRGAGPHELEMTYSLPLREEDDRTIVEGPLLSAASGSMEVQIDGLAEGSARPPYLETDSRSDRTRFRLTLGKEEAFALEWQQRQVRGESTTVLGADHRVSYQLEPRNPVFRWDARISIERTRTDRLRFQEPPGCTVVQVESPRVQSWDRVDGVLEVRFEEPLLGRVPISFAGLVTLTGETFTLGLPTLEGALRNHGLVALLDAPSTRLTVTSTTGLEEIAVNEGGVPDVHTEIRTPRPAPAASILRLYSFRASGARIVGTGTPLPFRFESRAAYLARIQERRATLDAFLQVEVQSGHGYELVLSLPPGWNLVRIAETPRGSSFVHGLHTEEFGADPDRQLRLLLDHAVDRDHPLELTARLELTTFAPAEDWRSAQIGFALPAFPAADRSRTDLGLSLHDSLFIDESTLTGWSSLLPEETRRLGLEGRAMDEARQARARLVAGLTTEVAAPRVDLGVERRPARGEYRAVTHILAAERAFAGQSNQHTLRVRCDLRLAVVDRGIDRLTFRLPPLPAGTNVIILGDGLKETPPGDPATGLYTARFVGPWLGTRELRVEYELPLTPGTAIAIPDITVALADGEFGHERYLVLQSQGSLEVLDEPVASALSSLDLDDSPDFAQPWTSGRILKAFRYRDRASTGPVGSLTITRHDRAPVLGHLARKMELTTVIGADGSSRTRAEFLLAYSKAQSLAVELPRDSRCLSVTIDGEPIHAVRVESGPDGRTHEIPLPPRSYATVMLLYERPDRGRVGDADSLGAWGTWREAGPFLQGIPVGEVEWTLHHPDGYRFFVTDGNMRPLDRNAERRVQTFASSFFGRLLGGRMPIWTAFRRDYPYRARVAVPELSAEEHAKAASDLASLGNRGTSARLAPRGQADAITGTPAAPVPSLFPEGRELRTVKFGGEPTIALSYRSFSGGLFARRSVFLLTLLALLIVRLRRGPGAFFRTIAYGLLFGTLIPVAFAWESPFLLIPFCEALVIGLFVAILYAVARTITGVIQRRLETRRALLTPTLPLVLIGVLAATAAVHADEPEKEPFDAVVIPYNPDAPPWWAPGLGGKVFLPRERFQQLTRLAQSGSEAGEDTPSIPHDVVLGPLSYRLALDGESYRLDASLKLIVFSGDWVKVPLPFDTAQLVRVTVDGEEVGTTAEGDVPTLALRGRGLHSLELQLAGTVQKDLGEFRIQTAIPPTPAARLETRLPEGSVVKLAASSPGTSARPGDSGTDVIMELGDARTLALTWSFPKIEGQIASQLESMSYSGLTLNRSGFDVLRRERLRVVGRPIESARYRILGDWQVTRVEGVDLAEWNVITTAPTPVLELYFSRPVTRFDGVIVGRALLADRGAITTLELENASRQETYIGLTHSARQRFLPDVLSNMKRTTRSDVATRFNLGDAEQPARIYQTYGSGAGQILAIGPTTSRLRVNTDAVALLQKNELLVFVRSRYTQVEAGPLRHRVEIPAGWTVRKVEGDGVRDWSLSADGTELRVDLHQRATAGLTITWSAERKLETVPTTLELPPLRMPDATNATTGEHTIHWTLAAGEDLKLTSPESQTWEPVALERSPRWVELPEGSDYRFGYRTRRSDTPLRVLPTERQSRVTATVVSFVRPANTRLQVNARVAYRVRFAGEERFTLRLPAGSELVYADARNQRSLRTVQSETGTLLEIDLQSPIRGEQYIDLVYQIPRPVGPGSQVTLRPVELLDGDRRLPEVDQYLGVLHTERTITLGTQAAGLAPVPPQQVPYLPAGISARSLGGTFRATEPTWQLTLGEEDIEVAEQADAKVVLADLSTRVGGDGTLRTQVVYSLLNESLQFLSIELPAGARLWGVTVNGRSVAVGRPGPAAAGAGEILRIPVERAGRSEPALEVAVHYEEPPLSLPSFREVGRLTAPRILDPGVAVQESIWSVQFPDDYTVSERAERMRQAPTSVKYASKLKTLVEQRQSILDAAQKSDSRRAKQRAAQSLARIEQALGDNIAELKDPGRRQREDAQADQIGARFLQQKWAENDRVMRDAEVVQKELQSELQKAREGSDQGLPRDEEAFNDRANFLRGGAWHDLRDLQGGRQNERPAGGLTPEILLEEHGFQGWRDLKPRGVTPGATFSQATPVDPANGLRPLPEVRRTETTPELKLEETQAGTTTFTFRQGVGTGRAQLELVFAKRGAYPRFGAWLVLLGILAIYFGSPVRRAAWAERVRLLRGSLGL